MKLLKVTFKKSQKLLAENLRERPPIQNISIAIFILLRRVIVTAVLAIVHTELRAREASSFCDFWNTTSCDFTLFYYFLTQANIIFF